MRKAIGLLDEPTATAHRWWEIVNEDIFFNIFHEKFFPKMWKMRKYPKSILECGENSSYWRM